MYISIADIFLSFFFFFFLIPVNMVQLCGKVMVAGKNDFLHSTKTKFTTTIGFPPPGVAWHALYLLILLQPGDTNNLFDYTTNSFLSKKYFFR